MQRGSRYAFYILLLVALIVYALGICSVMISRTNASSHGMTSTSTQAAVGADDAD